MSKPPYPPPEKTLAPPILPRPHKKDCDCTDCQYKRWQKYNRDKLLQEQMEELERISEKKLKIQKLKNEARHGLSLCEDDQRGNLSIVEEETDPADRAISSGKVVKNER
jgi:hypothetical protein